MQYHPVRTDRKGHTKVGKTWFLQCEKWKCCSEKWLFKRQGQEQNLTKVKQLQNKTKNLPLKKKETQTNEKNLVNLEDRKGKWNERTLTQQTTLCHCNVLWCSFILVICTQWWEGSFGSFNSTKVVFYIKYTQPDSLGYWWLIIKLNTSGLHCEPMLCQHLPKLNVLSMDDQLLSRDLLHHINFLVDFKAWPLGYPTIFFSYW